DGLLQGRCNGAQSRPEREQISHAGDAALGLHVEHEEIACIAEGVAPEPRRLGPGDTDEGGVEGGDGEVGHGGCAARWRGNLRSRLGGAGSKSGTLREISAKLLTSASA